MKLYCPVCNSKQEVSIISKEETYPVKGEPITIMPVFAPVLLAAKKFSPYNTMMIIFAGPMQFTVLVITFCSLKKSRPFETNTAYRR